MDGALSIIEGQDGILKDKYGRPMIIVYDSNLKRASSHGAKWNILNRPQEDPKTLVFINTAEPKPKDGATRKLIRTHVMQNLQRAKRQSIHKSHSKKPSHVGAHQETVGANLLYADSLFGPITLLQQPSGSLDPFASYPIPMKPHMYRLIHHYLSVVVQNMYPKEPCWRYGPGQPGLFTLALTNSALFHMIICSSAIYMDVYAGRQESREGRLHKLEAIQSLNDGMKDTSGISDASIGAVAYLAKVEFTLGNHDMWKIHRDGMIKMIELRGGIKQLGLSLQGKVLITDLVGCVETDSPPYLPLLDLSDDEWDAKAKAPPVKLSSGFRNIISRFSLNPELVENLQDGQSLTALLTRARDEISPFNQRDIGHFATELRYRLLKCRIPENYLSETALIGELCRLSLFLHLRTILRAFPTRGRNNQVIIGKLRTCIEMAESTLHSTPEFHLWILFVAAAASYDNTDQTWFVSKIPNVASISYLRSWDETKIILQQFWWVESIYDSYCRALWNEAMLLKARAYADEHQSDNRL